MGSQEIQARLWGRSPQDWSTIQEATGQAGYDHTLNALGLIAGDQLLDIGCGSGLFASQAAAKGATVTGIDASEALIEEAKKRVAALPSSGTPAITFLTGEMEELPFKHAEFDVITGFNSFQYAANIGNAFAEARRVLKDKGQLVAMIWGEKKDCEAATYLQAIGSLLPPPPPGAPGPFALTDDHLLEKKLEEAGFTVNEDTDIPTIWDYPDTAAALKGLLSAGPASRAIEHSGLDKVYETISKAIQPYIQSNGHVVYHNKFRIVIATK